MKNKSFDNWTIYIVRCADKTLYTGIAKDIEQRLDEHNNNNMKASRYTRVRRPVNLVYSEILGSRSEATRREIEIKKLDKGEKEALIRQQKTMA